MLSGRPQCGVEWVPGGLQRVVRNDQITAYLYLCNEVSRFTRRKYNLNRKKHRLQGSILQQKQYASQSWVFSHMRLPFPTCDYHCDDDNFQVQSINNFNIRLQSVMSKFEENRGY